MANIFTCLKCSNNRTNRNCWKINLCPRKGYTPADMNKFTGTVKLENNLTKIWTGNRETIKKTIKRVTIKITKTGMLV